MTYLIGGKKRSGFTLFETVVVIGVFGVIITLVLTIFSNASASQRREAVSQKALSDARLMLNTLQQDVRGQRIDYDFYKGNDQFPGPPTSDASCATFNNDQCDLTQASGVTVLALVNDLGQKTRYWFDAVSKKLKVCRNNPLIAPRNCNGSGVNYQNITPNSLTLNRFNFVITPASDPGLRASPQLCSSNADCTCTKTKINYALGQICNSWTSGYCDVSGTRNCLIPDIQPNVTASLELQSQGLAVGSVTIPMEITVTTRSYVR